MYKNIARNKRNTLILLFVLIGIVAAPLIYLGLEAGDFTIVGGIGIFLAVYTILQYYLAGKVAVMASHAVPITKEDNPRLWRIVENLSISEGIPMPKTYIIPDDGLNAFAAGRDPEHAIIAFTRGILNALDDNELEGVAAHEIAHIKNYDIRVSTFVFGIISALLILADIAIRLGISGSRNRSTAPFGIGLLAVGVVSLIIGYIIGPMLSAAVSREREYLADASAVEMTRYPEGIKGALEKLQANSRPMDSQVRGLSHMYFSLPKAKGFFSNLYASHPPLEKRIERISNTYNSF
jgi:heat shock protein HtpX